MLLLGGMGAAQAAPPHTGNFNSWRDTPPVAESGGREYVPGQCWINGTYYGKLTTLRAAAASLPTKNYGWQIFGTGVTGSYTMKYWFCDSIVTDPWIKG